VVRGSPSAPRREVDAAPEDPDNVLRDVLDVPRDEGLAAAADGGVAVDVRFPLDGT